MSTSWTEPLRAWLRERFRLRVFLPLAALLVGVSLLGSAATSAWELMQRLALALGLLAQFRLWDDLHDRELDRGAHPGRVLVRQARTGPFVALVVTLAAANLCATALVASPASALGLLLPLNGGLLAWYAWSRRSPSRRLLHVHGVLLKYPVFALVLADGVQGVEAGFPACLGALYLLFALHELADDAGLRARRGARALLWTEALALLLFLPLSLISVLAS